MKFDIDLNDLNPGVWFNLDDNDREEALCLRFLPIEKVREFAKQTTTTKINFVVNESSRRMEAVNTYDRDATAYDDMVYDFTIVDWRLKDRQDNAIPCTKENKLKLMHEYVPFHRFYLDCVEKLTKLHSQEKEEQKKTSGTSQGD